MAITIKSSSLTGKYIPITSVYNPINYIVDSDKRGRDSFNYIADIYYDGDLSSGRKFAARLNTFPNLTNFYGQFDVHRTLENFVSSDPFFNTTDIAVTSNSTKRFVVEFGETFSSQNRFTSFAQGPLIFPGAYYLKVNFENPHNLAVGDGVYVVKDDVTVDGYLTNLTTRVFSANTAYQVTLEAVFGTGGTAQTGVVFEGKSFLGTFNSGGYLGLMCINPHNMSVGDSIIIAAYNTNLNPSYDGQWNVTALSGTNVLVTNVPYGTYYINEAGTIYIKGNVVLTGLTSSMPSGYTFIHNSVDDYDQKKSFGASRELSGFTLTSSSSRYLTNCPVPKVRPTDYHTVNYLCNYYLSAGTTPADKIVFFFEAISGGSETADFNIPGLYTASTNLNYTNFILPVGPRNIDSLFEQSIITSSMTGVNWTTISRYGFFAIYYPGSFAFRSQFYIFDVDNDCSKYETYRFMWLNRLGAFDYFNFRKRSDNKYTVEKSSYETMLGSYDGVNYGYNIGDAGKVVNNVKITENVTVYSDWVNEATSEWLFELISSPEVYVLDGENKYPVIITTNEYIPGKRANEKLFNLKLEFDYAFEKIAQRG